MSEYQPLIKPLIINGWTIFAHSLFLEQLEELIIQVENLRQKYPQEYKQKNATKRLAAIFKLAFNVIPQDPTLNDYRQGITLGDEYKHWFRAKFFQQYRLFFRYHQHGKIIVYAWVNEEKSKRAFQKMLESGNPPDEWNDLLKEAESETNRLEQVFKTEI
ncbi:type II toxin-antitoxin system YhaV family toxin [Sphaerospermopsis torques-reginae]|uniref:type II toxin-antitoxin system YhaV family toxin n=1 Tax=Sphaerospermopsis torques-reginae TaxID=984207 RepID=UPI001FE3AF7C|nr:type II toxin-antitoxin system YhaV family toxin [Sphaerospermopsis torques-reginae]